MTLKEKIDSIDYSKIGKPEAIKSFVAKVEEKAKSSMTEAQALMDGILVKIQEKYPDAITKKIAPEKAKSVINKLKKLKNIVPRKADYVKVADQIQKQQPNFTRQQAEELAKLRIEAQIARSSSFNDMIDVLSKSSFYSGRLSTAPIDKARGRDLQKDSNRSSITEADELKMRKKGVAPRKYKRISKAGHKNQYGTTSGGNVYYEYRDNRRDVDSKIRLAQGGLIGKEVEFLRYGEPMTGRVYEDLGNNRFAVESSKGVHSVDKNNIVKVIEPKKGRFFGLFKKGGRIDLFETPDKIPAKIQEILDFYEEDFQDGRYDGLSKALKEVEANGYTFEFYLDGEAYGLRPKNVPLNHIKGYEEEYSKGGGVEFWKPINVETISEVIMRLPDIDFNETLLSGKIWIAFKKQPKGVTKLPYEVEKAIKEDFEYFSYGQRGNFVQVSLMEGSWFSMYIDVKNLTFSELEELLLELPEKVNERLEEKRIKGYGELGFYTYGEYFDIQISDGNTKKYVKGGGVGKFNVGDKVKFNQDPSGKLSDNIYYGTILEINNGIAKIDHQNSNMKNVTRKVNVENLQKYSEGGGVEGRFKKHFKKGGNVKATYIPNASIKSLTTKYGSTIKGKDLLDGAYTTRKNVKLEPKVDRFMFEEEMYEYSKGGGVGFKGKLTGIKFNNRHRKLIVGNVIDKQNVPDTKEKQNIYEILYADTLEYFSSASEYLLETRLLKDSQLYSKGGVPKYALGDVIDDADTPKVWVGEWSLYNEGKLIGEWVDLTRFESGAEVMQYIQSLLDKWTKETGELREEYAIFDYENFPSSLYSEQMGEDAFDKVLLAYNFSQENDIPMDVVGTIIEEYGADDLDEWFSERYAGQFDSDTDLAYWYVDEMLGGVEQLDKRTQEMYFDYEAFGRDLAINDYRDIDGYYFQAYKRGGMTKQSLNRYFKRK